MIEKDNIQELFSKAFENQTSAVRPELWTGLQAKMAAAGVASTATVATKGLSALTKWIIGSAAVGTVGVVTAVVALNSGQQTTGKKNDSPKEISQNIPAPNPEENFAEDTETPAHTTYTEPHVISNEPFEDIPQETNPNRKDIVHDDMKWADGSPVSSDHKTESKSDDKKTTDPGVKITEDKKGTTSSASSTSNKVTTNNESEYPKKHPENIKEPIFADLESKVTKFPTMFTPNGDRNNDTYFVTVENIHDFQLLIIDQNNREMFRTNNPNEEWNGTTLGGEEAPSGSYAAIVTGKQQNGKSFRDIQLFELRR